MGVCPARIVFSSLPEATSRSATVPSGPAQVTINCFPPGTSARPVGRPGTGSLRTTRPAGSSMQATCRASGTGGVEHLPVGRGGQDRRALVAPGLRGPGGRRGDDDACHRGRRPSWRSPTGGVVPGVRGAGVVPSSAQFSAGSQRGNHTVSSSVPGRPWRGNADRVDRRSGAAIAPFAPGKGLWEAIVSPIVRIANRTYRQSYVSPIVRIANRTYRRSYLSPIVRIADRTCRQPIAATSGSHRLVARGLSPSRHDYFAGRRSRHFKQRVSRT